MSGVDILREEHEAIERELIELEAIMGVKSINYSNLIHVVKKITYLFDAHIHKEMDFFRGLEEQGVHTSLHEMGAQYLSLQHNLQVLTRTMLSCSDCKTRAALLKEGIAFIEKARAHMQEQEWIFCALPESQLVELVPLASMPPRVQHKDMESYVLTVLHRNR